MDKTTDKKLVLIVMDGVGLRDSGYGNAVMNANTPVLDKLLHSCPNVRLTAHGKAVGLPSDEDMGNSEVGHNAIGCGQVYSQGAKLVGESIESGLLFKSPVWKKLSGNCVKNESAMHFIGLLSDGNVHSNIAHLFALLEGAKIAGVKRARVHVLLDGRDVAPPLSAQKYIGLLEDKLSELRGGGFDARIASGGGRMAITMDRYEANWDMVKLGYETHVLGIGRQFANAADAVSALQAETKAETDQYTPPFVIAENGKPVGTIEDGDSVILFNFRGDRALEISQALDREDFTAFKRERFPKIMYAGMLQYDGDLKIPNDFLVEPPHIRHTLSEHLIKHNIRQFAVSETQKFGHVTYFWNGNRSEKFSKELETFMEIESDKGDFDQRPWMKAADVTDVLIQAMKSGQYDFLRANFPNGDMVGHTGNYDAAVTAVETVDLCLSRIAKAAKELGMALIITADHGNADEMYGEADKNGKVSPKTAHSLSAVPFIVYNSKVKLKSGAFGLSSIAATVTEIMGLDADEHWDEGLAVKV